jgi:galactosylceramidase
VKTTPADAPGLKCWGSIRGVFVGFLEKSVVHRIRWSLLIAISAAASVGAAGQASETQRIRLEAKAGGKRFDGIGVVTGGGGTAVLLKDYPEPQRSQILDMLYKPKFGASISALYVEIPGDGNATQGSMPSHMHTRDDLNYSRGYLWWEMVEARKRNPHLSLDGAAWSAPGWIGSSGTIFPQSTGNFYKGDAKFFSQDTADYYVKWLKGLRDVYGLQFEAIGSRNEKGASYGFVKALRATLDANGFRKMKIHGFDNWPDKWKFSFVNDMLTDEPLRDSIDIIGAHINAPASSAPADVQAMAAKMNKPIWNTEQHVYKAGYDGLIGLVQAFNENYIRSGVTKVVNWYGIAGLYTMESYSGDKEAALRANWPWSGHYRLNQSLWGYAHYGQFTEIGWEYLKDGSGDLGAGGTYVTLKSPKGDYSIIIETTEAKAPQRVQFEIGKGLSGQRVAVWRSNDKEQFIRQADLQPVNGTVSIALDPASVYSLTTTDGQRKGSFDKVPDSKPFPFPYFETFEQYAKPQEWGYLPRYFADIAGAFEIGDCPGGKGRCMRQAVPVPTISWAPDWLPYTIVGDDQWQDYEVSADVYLNPGESAAVMGRVNHVGTGYGFIPKGYFLQLGDGGQLRLVVVRGKVDKKKLVGDGEQQALIKAQNDNTEGGEKVLAATDLPNIAGNQWHNLKLRFEGARITAIVDGKQVLGATDTLYPAGMAGLMAGPAAGKKLSMPYFDNVLVNRADAPVPAASQAAPGQAAIYPIAK